MDKPYLRKQSIVSGFTVWIVDGNYIRTNLDEEFSNFGQHYRFNFIPKNEFWIDHEASKRKETEFYIDHLLEENRLLKQGKKYNYALLKADQLEKMERQKSPIYQEFKNKILKGIKIKIIKKYSQKVDIWIVDGELVRDRFFLDFTEGGHHYRYRFIPPNEVWIDDDISPRERKYVILHELTERNLMAERLHKTKNWKNRPTPYKVYGWAHQKASEMEHYCRLHPNKIDQKLTEVLEKNN